MNFVKIPKREFFISLLSFISSGIKQVNVHLPTDLINQGPSASPINRMDILIPILESM